MSDLGNKEVMANNLRRYVEKSGKDRKQIAEELGFPYSTFTDWMNAKKYPRIDRIEKMADYFGVLKSDLIESNFDRTREEIVKKAVLDGEILRDKELMKALYVYNTLTDKQKKAIINSIYSYRE